MALRINLYHEIQLARKQQRYDPLKISMICLGFAILCLAGWYVVRYAETNTVREQYAANQAELAKITPQSEKAKIDEAELTKTIQLSSALTKRIEGRFYWAPVMEIIGRVIPRNVQVARLSGDLATTETSRRVGMSIEGVAAGEHPRKVAEDIRLALIDAFGQKFTGVTASFRSLDDGTDRVKLDGVDVGTVLYSISLSFAITGADDATNSPKTAKQ